MTDPTRSFGLSHRSLTIIVASILAGLVVLGADAASRHLAADFPVIAVVTGTGILTVLVTVRYRSLSTLGLNRRAMRPVFFSVLLITSVAAPAIGGPVSQPDTGVQQPRDVPSNTDASDAPVEQSATLQQANSDDFAVFVGGTGDKVEKLSPNGDKILDWTQDGDTGDDIIGTSQTGSQISTTTADQSGRSERTTAVHDAG